jgi:hypothetical protein
MFSVIKSRYWCFWTLCSFILKIMCLHVRFTFVEIWNFDFAKHGWSCIDQMLKLISLNLVHSKFKCPTKTDEFVQKTSHFDVEKISDHWLFRCTNRKFGEFRCFHFKFSRLIIWTKLLISKNTSVQSLSDSKNENSTNFHFNFFNWWIQQKSDSCLWKFENSILNCRCIHDDEIKNWTSYFNLVLVLRTFNLVLVTRTLNRTYY